MRPPQKNASSDASRTGQGFLPLPWAGKSAPNVGPMSWQHHLAQIQDLDREDPRKWQMADQFAQAIGGQFLQGHQAVHNKTDGELELRGRYHDYPARMKMNMSFGDVEWDLKAPNPADTTLYLHWDMDAVPNVGEFQGQAASDWDDDAGSSTKVFFGKGFYLDADAQEIDRQLAIYQSLPEPVRQALATYMPGDGIARYYLYGHGEQHLGFDKRPHEMPDPLNQVGRGLWLMGQVAWGLTQVNPATLPAPAQPAAQGLLHKMTCAYCGSIYLWSQNQACPNCGAPPRG
jgi:hypothetical protein